MTRMRLLFLNCALVILVSPSFVQITEGSGSPLTSQVNITRSPTAKVCLSGSSRTTGFSEKNKSINVQFSFNEHLLLWKNLYDNRTEHIVLFILVRVIT